MLQALLSYDDKTAVFNLPHNSLEVENYLLAVGTMKPYADLRLNDDEDDLESVQIKLIAKTDADSYLQSMFSQDARLSTINTVCDFFYRLPAEQQADLSNDMAAGLINSEKGLLEAIKAMKPAEPVRVDFYCPLTILMDDPESGKVVDADNSLLIGQEHHILSEIERTVMNFNIVDFFTRDDCADSFGAKEKLLSAKWGVENIGGTMYGCISVEVNKPLTESEKEDIANWIYNENQTGFGDSFSIRPIDTSNGRLYINFWQNNDQYFLLDETEYKHKFGRELKTQNQGIIFSRVKLWTDTGEDCEFFMGGVPKSYDDIDENDDFEDFMEYLSTGDTKEITAYVTTFSEGESEPQPASQADIDRINDAIANVDIDTITGWNRIGESQFTFDCDIDELFNMKGIE